MTSLKTRKIESALRIKGFYKKDAHHKKYTLYVDGKRTSIYTFISHGIKEYNDHLLNKMKDQLGITKEELHDLIECPLDGEEYLGILSSKGLI